MSLISLKNVSKFYYSKGVIASGFSKLNLDLDDGEFVAITGESGSGKSTLLNVISGLDSYEEGEMYINGKETSHYTEKDFEDYRRKYIGNIFQSFNLVNSYTVYQNIELVLLLNGEKKKNIKRKVLSLINEVGLYQFRNQKVSKLSGGQKQRVAIARALAKDTPIIIADEPTGNLDSTSASEVLNLLSKIAKDKLVIVVTHNYDQIEKYVTRKITMHDGKITEDKKISIPSKKENIKTSIYKNTTVFNKLRLGIRNAFNIKVKFLLLLFIYLFISFALAYEYSSYKEDKYVLSKEGFNNYLVDTDDKRIIINKKSKEPFTEEDYKKLAKIDNINIINKNDAIIDEMISIYDDKDYWITGLAKDIKSAQNIKLDVGRMPSAENEIVIATFKDNYLFSGELENVLDSTYYLINNQSGDLVRDHKLKIVGVKYESYDNLPKGYDAIIYIDESISNYFALSANQRYSSTTVKLNNTEYKLYPYDFFLQVTPNKHVPKGKAYISSNYTYLCKNYKCKGKKIDINVENIYFTDNLSLKIDKVYSKKNFKKLTKLKNYYMNEGKLFINEEDYNNLYNKGIYQATVRVKDVNKIDKTSKALKENGYNMLIVKDTLVVPNEVYVLDVVKTIVIIALVFVLFVITYFVTKVVLKSRNIYFSTIRMLGSTKKVCKKILSIELVIVSNIAYFLFLGLLLAHKFKICTINLLKVISSYITYKELIIIYIIINLMSYLISIKFAHNIFKKSAISSLKEEV